MCAGHLFRASHQSLRFAGFIAVYEEGTGRRAGGSGRCRCRIWQRGSRLNADPTSRSSSTFTQPPARYTEATLVKAMEEKGVGRPSTYAAIVSTIQDREYVVKKDKRLCPDAPGRGRDRADDGALPAISSMWSLPPTWKTSLDDVEDGQAGLEGQFWRNSTQDFHQEMVGRRRRRWKACASKVPEEETDEVCELCGRKMVVKTGRFGKFLACPGYPECKNTKPLVERMPGRCPKCGSGMLKRKSKQGLRLLRLRAGRGMRLYDLGRAHRLRIARSAVRPCSRNPARGA